MKLSIIVPFHRGKHFLEDCFESIRDQGLTGYETILVLDHVREELSDLIDQYQDLNLRVISLDAPVTGGLRYIKEDNIDILMGLSGAAAARNAALNAAMGDYVYFLDSDDYILGGTLPHLLKEAMEQQADFVYGRKTTTWFKRKVFLASQEKQNQAELTEEQDQEEGSIQEDTPINGSLMTMHIEDELQKILRGHEPIHIRQMAEAYDKLFITRKGIRNVSVVGILFDRGFLEKNRIRFNEKCIFYPDMGFLVRTLDLSRSCSFVEEAVYVKRKHNDPIHYPSLSQLKTEDRFEEYIGVYKEARELSKDNAVLRCYIEAKLIVYFTRVYAPRLRRSGNKIWQNERFFMMQVHMKEVDQGLIKSLRGYKKRLIRALLQGKVKKVKRIVSLYLGLKKLKQMRKKWRVFAYYLYQHYFLKLPVKENWVLCESFFGKSYSDSPKYIYEYLNKNYPGKYRFIWVVNKRTKIPYHPVKVKRFSVRYAYYLARCKYDIFNVRQPEWVKKRKSNVFLETWHGTPLKKLVFDQEEVMAASPLYKAQFYKQSRVWDYLISANHFSTEAFRSAFLYDKEVLEYGYPRNDILHSAGKEEIAAKVKRRLRIPEGKKIILYAPTWRDDEYYGRGEYKFSLKLDLHLLQKELGEDYLVLLRTHYFIADSMDITGLKDFVVNVSKYDDISELYLISDLLITDYSSVFFDYANLKRPILFYTYDLDKYRDILRGFYMDIEKDVPGPLLFTDQEVVAAIRDIDRISLEYKEKYEGFYEKYCGLEDGHASEKVAKRVFSLD